MERILILVRCFTVSVIFLVLPQPLFGQSSVTLMSSKDNTLYENANGDISNGSGIFFFVGRNNQSMVYRGLLKFPVAENIPVEANIDSVQLVLNMSRTIAGVEPISLHRVLTDWGEGESDAGIEGGDGDQSQPGDATWIHTFFNTELWTNPGGDYSQTISAVQNVGNLGSYTWSSDQMTADVLDWKNNPGMNFGWILVGDETQNQTTKRFDTKENVEMNRPRLIVYYSPATAVTSQDDYAPQELTLYQNYPNPFNPTTWIRYELRDMTYVSITIFDMQGSEIENLVEARVGAGVHQLEWHGTDNKGEHLPSGLYIYRVVAGNSVRTGKMTLLK